MKKTIKNNKEVDNNLLFGVFTLGMLVGGLFVLILAKLLLK